MQRTPWPRHSQRWHYREEQLDWGTWIFSNEWYAGPLFHRHYLYLLGLFAIKIPLKRKSRAKAVGAAAGKTYRSPRDHTGLSSRRTRTCYWIGCVGVREMAKWRMTLRFLACTSGWHLVSLKWRYLEERIKFCLHIHSDLPTTHPQQHAKIAVECIGLEAQKISWN